MRRPCHLLPGARSWEILARDKSLLGDVLGNYRMVRLLGKGGMGEVYRADDLKLRQPVALKFLPEALSKDPKKLERFLHEVRVARQVSHPNVCRVYDIAEADGQHFISMEYVDGEDLAVVLRRMGRPSKEKALQIARQLCAGLAAAHDKGVLHRDLKPHNVMIDGQGRVRITDFGLAGFAGDFIGKEVYAGTPAYMAPEQLTGGRRERKAGQERIRGTRSGSPNDGFFPMQPGDRPEPRGGARPVGPGARVPARRKHTRKRLAFR